MKRYLAIALLVILTTSVILTGCGQQAPTNQGSDVVMHNTLEKVLMNKKVRVGILPDYAPWGSRNAQGQFEGYDADLAMLLGEALGVEVELIPIEAPNRVPALASDKVDVIIACLTPTDERAKSVTFTIPYASAGLVPMVMADNNEVKSYHDLAGRTVAVVRGGTPDLFTAAIIPEAKLIRFDTIADAYTAFKTGKAEVFVEEDTFVFYETSKNPQYKAVGEPFSRELLSFAVKKNDQEWLNYLNNFLTNLRFTGKNAEVYKKWFGHEPAPLTLY
jgi:polar amino acid transport system substrate-binding protein